MNTFKQWIAISNNKYKMIWIKLTPKILTKMKQPICIFKEIKMIELIINSIFHSKLKIFLSRRQEYQDIFGKYLSIHFYL